jgi:hypothetical protein
MTVGDLIEKLSTFDPGTEVFANAVSAEHAHAREGAPARTAIDDENQVFPVWGVSSGTIMRHNGPPQNDAVVFFDVNNPVNTMTGAS